MSEEKSKFTVEFRASQLVKVLGYELHRSERLPWNLLKFNEEAIVDVGKDLTCLMISF